MHMIFLKIQKLTNFKKTKKIFIYEALMLFKGIRIPDKKNGIICVELLDILAEVNGGNSFYWSILFLDMIGKLSDDIDLVEFQDEIFKMEKGLFISWKDLNIFAKKPEQIIDITLLGCKDKNLIRRYDNDKELFETCDIVIEMIDSFYWLIFSKDEKLIERLANKFENSEFVSTDF